MRGIPHYSITLDDEPVIHPSTLGLRFASRASLARDLRIVSRVDSSNDTTWEQPWGERRLVRDHYKEALFILQSTKGPARELRLRVRVHNDGVGFRYEVPEQDYYDQLNIVDELTEFHVPDDATAWWIPGRGYNRYEYLYRTTPSRRLTWRTRRSRFVCSGDAFQHPRGGAGRLLRAMVLDQRRPGIFEADLTPWSDGIRVKNADAVQDAVAHDTDLRRMRSAC